MVDDQDKRDEIKDDEEDNTSSSGGGGGTADDEQEEEADLAKQIEQELEKEVDDLGLDPESLAYKLFKGMELSHMAGITEEQVKEQGLEVEKQDLPMTKEVAERKAKEAEQFKSMPNKDKK